MVSEDKAVVRFVRKSADAILPCKGTPASAGFDLFSMEKLVLASGQRALVGTGWDIALPEGYQGEVRPRSGNAIKRGLTVLNSPGTIDFDYRGELKVILINHSKDLLHINKGDRIAQLVVTKLPEVDVVEVSCFEDHTQRGRDGFGSTGV